MAANEKRMPEGEPIKSDIMPEGDEWRTYYEYVITINDNRFKAMPTTTTLKTVGTFLITMFCKRHILDVIRDEGFRSITIEKVTKYYKKGGNDETGLEH